MGSHNYVDKYLAEAADITKLIDKLAIKKMVDIILVEEKTRPAFYAWSRRRRW